MEKFLKKLGNFLYIFSFLIRSLRSVWIRIYTGYHSAKFRKFGRKSLIIPSCVEILGMSEIEVGDNCILGEGITLTAYKSYEGQVYTPSIVISDSVSLGCRNHITCINRIFIGKNVLTGPDVLISDNSHGNSSEEETKLPPKKRDLYSKGPVIIEDNVWIGEKASIMPGVRIGKGAIVGCNAVVTRDVPENCIVAGAPAKIIKYINK